MWASSGSATNEPGANKQGLKFTGDFQGDLNMRRLIKAALVMVLLTAVPAWADRGHDGWRDGHRHHYRGWKYEHHPHRGHPGHWREPRRVVQHIYQYEPYPTQSASASPGIHVIFPDVYLPWPQ
jgi:hypothetical protein